MLIILGRVPHIGAKWKVKVAQSCPTLFNPIDYTIHRILQARILEWVVIPFSRGSSQPRDLTQVSHIAGGFFTSWATVEWVWANSRRQWRTGKPGVLQPQVCSVRHNLGTELQHGTLCGNDDIGYLETNSETEMQETKSKWFCESF